MSRQLGRLVSPEKLKGYKKKPLHENHKKAKPNEFSGCPATAGEWSPLQRLEKVSLLNDWRKPATVFTGEIP